MSSFNSFGSYDPMAAADFIASFEGESLEAYTCPAGVLTIGIGHTGPDVHRGMRITKERSRELFRRDIERIAAQAARYVNAPVTAGMHVALLSLAFNVGSLPAKFPRLLRKLNSGDYEGAAEEFLDGDRAGGKRLPGLTRRRRAEYEKFLEGL